jgi:hypothetical protein
MLTEMMFISTIPLESKDLGVAILEVGCGRSSVLIPPDQYLRTFNGTPMNLDRGSTCLSTPRLVGMSAVRTKSNTQTWTAQVGKNDVATVA